MGFSRGKLSVSVVWWARHRGGITHISGISILCLRGSIVYSSHLVIGECIRVTGCRPGFPHHTAFYLFGV